MSENPMTLNIEEQKEHVVAVIRAIEATILKRATSDDLEKEIQTSTGRTKIAKVPFGELISIRDKYKQELVRLERAEKVSAGGGKAKKIIYRFV